MIEPHRRIAFLIFLCSLASINCLQNTALCTDSRKYEYTSCLLNYRDRTLWCDSTNVTTIPKPNEVPGNVISSKHAKILFANKSCIHDISLDAMREYTRILKFDGSDNLIKELQNQAFAKCGKLRELDFTKNYITHISKDHLHGTHQLEKLILVDNELESIGEKCFHGNSKLKILDVCRNRLKEFHSNVFPAKCNLHSLKASDNVIMNWMKPKQHQFNKLTELDLSYNIIVKLSHANFAGMTSLRFLNLSNNLISSLSRSTFVDAKLLESLDLRDNRIQKLHKHMFSNNCKLKSLYLAGNYLQTPHFQWFIAVLAMNDDMSALTNVLDDNKWNCNCTTVDYWNFLSQSSEKIPNNLDIECTTPNNLEGRKLSSLNSADLKPAQCEDEASHNITNRASNLPLAYAKMCPAPITKHVNAIRGPADKNENGSSVHHFPPILLTSFCALIAYWLLRFIDK